MKKLFLLVVSVLLFSSLAQASDLKGRFGIGLNWPGIQARYGITNSILAEFKAQFASNNTTIGGREYYLFKEIPGNIPIIPYAGGEFSWVISQYLKYGGYLAGGFGGVELMVTKHIGIGIDAGLYYVSLTSTLGTYPDWGIIFNGGLTYYF